MTEVTKAEKNFHPTYSEHLKKMPDLANENWLVCANQACLRCIVIIDEGSVKAFNSEGDEVTIIESLLDLLRVLPDGIVLDGGISIQNPDGSFLKDDDACNAILWGKNQIEHFTYNVVDCLSVDEFYGRAESPILSERLERIAEVAEVLLLAGKTGHNHLYYAPQLKADEAVVQMLRDGMESAGWRGIILRKDVPYVRGNTPNILKINVPEK